MSTPCPACGALFEAEDALDPFEALGLPAAYEVDAKLLKRRLLDLTRRMHPDFFGTADAELRALAERNTAAVNEAHEELSDDLRRADGIVRRLGGPDENAERQMPQEFLMEVLEWNETLEDQRERPPIASGDALDTLEAELKARRADTLAEVGKLLTPLPEAGAPVLTEVRRNLNALRYLQKTLAEIGALRLDRASSH
jgi:molecular chaperone HscB